MKTVRIDKNDVGKYVKIVADAIKNGKVIVAPTDTVYGLIADAMNKKAVERVFKIKKREKGNPLPIFVKDIKMAKKFVHIDKNQEKILKSVWPGKVTVVLKSKIKNQKSKIYGVSKNTIALRIPKYNFINKLLGAASFPLTGTSANISGKPSSTKIKEIIKQFKGQKYQPDLFIDAGNLKKSLSSIIVDITSEEIKILR
ncbi:MAG: L-threonylcarbamoyladenylate synthase [Patescibacteria group bacterium]